MTEKEPVTAIEGTEPTKEKEDVICPVCDTFEPQAWRKTMCRNCFHHIDEHGDGNDADKSEKGSDLEKKKTKDSSVKEKTPSKDEPPKTLPKTGIASKSKGLSKLSKSDNKDTALSSPTSKSPVKLQAIKDDSSKGKLSSALTSTSSKKQTTHDKNVSASAKSDTKNDNQPDNKKQTGTGPSALSKWKNQTANLVSDKEKKAADEKAKEIPEEKEKQKGGTVKKFSDDKLNKNKVIEDKHISKDSANKSKAEEISKVRQFGRSISEGGSDDKKFNSLDRLHRGYKDTVDKASTGPSPASPTDKKLAIKQHSTTDSTQKQILGTASGTDKKEASATKTSTALSEKVNKFSSLTQEYNKNGQRKGSFGKNASVEREMPPAGSMSGEGQRLDGELEKLKKKLDEMEKKCNTLEKENINLKKGLEVKEQLEGNLQKQKLDVENAIKGLQGQLNSMVSRCSKLETDNTDLLDKLKVQKETHKESPIDVTSTEQFKEMEADLNQSEIDIENLQKENEGLKTEIQDLKVEMDEMYDSFREQEAEEFRDLQRELEMTAKNCRVLQFKLRKAERRNDQIETDRKEYEDKLRTLQNQFEDADARAHIHTIEEELRMAKEVSVRLHDELDILDDKRQKVDEENSHLTRLLEHSDKKQFRLEMEVDKLRDQLTDLRKQLAERSQPGTPSSEEITDRKSIYTELLND